MPAKDTDNYRQRTLVTLGGYTSPKDLKDIESKMINLINDRNIGRLLKMVVRHELHKDGQHHYHIATVCEKGFYKAKGTSRNWVAQVFTDCREFDIQFFPKGHEERMFRYVLKPDNFPADPTAKMWNDWEWGAQSEDGTYTNICSTSEFRLKQITMDQLMELVATTACEEKSCKVLIDMIQSKRKWSDVLMDEDTCLHAQKKLSWVQDVWGQRPAELPDLDIEYKTDGLPDINKLLPWQRALFNILWDPETKASRPCENSCIIYWIWSDLGADGKSQFKNFCECMGLTTFEGVFSQKNMQNYCNEDVIWYDDFEMKADGKDEYKETFMKSICDHKRMACHKYKGNKFVTTSHVIVTCNQAPMGSPAFMRRIIEFSLGDTIGEVIGVKDHARSGERAIYKSHLAHLNLPPAINAPQAAPEEEFEVEGQAWDL